MKGQDIPMRGDFEFDCLTGWHKVLCYCAKPGVRKAAKRSFNKRLRRTHKASLLAQSGGDNDTNSAR